MNKTEQLTEWGERLIKLETSMKYSIDNLNSRIERLTVVIEKLAANQERLDAFIVQQANINNRLNNVENNVDDHQKEDQTFHQNIRDHLFELEKKHEAHQAKIKGYLKIAGGLITLVLPVIYTVVNQLIGKLL